VSLTDDFYGIAVTIHDDGSETVERLGGYEPRPLTAEQLRPWLVLAQKSLEKEGLWPTAEQPCIAA
jgi:hypothetical protein